MNNKGFTLIELLAVILILSTIFSIPILNIPKIIDNNKKEEFIVNANNIISKAKYAKDLKKYQSFFIPNGNCNSISMKNLGYYDIKDPDGNFYDLDNSLVNICLEDESYVYYIKTFSLGNNTRGVFSNSLSFVKEDNLTTSFVNNFS